MRPSGLDPARSLDEGAGVVVVLRDTGGDSEDVRVEDDIAGAEPDALGEQAIGALAYGELALRCFRLPLLVEGHDHHGRAVALHQPGLFQEGRLPLLEADGIDHGLARDRPQARLDGRPVGRIDHHGHARDVRLGRDEAEKAGHGGLAVQHPLVHVDVDDLGAVLDLLARDLQGSRVVAGGNQLAELGRAGDVGALAHIDEGAAIVAALEGLEPGETEPGRVLRHCARRMSRDRVCDSGDVRGRGAAAAADQVDQAGLGPLAQLRGGLVGRFVIAAELVGEPGIGVGADPRLGDPRQVGDVGAHVGRPEGAVEPDAERFGMSEGEPERLDGLAVEHAARAIGDGARDEDGQPGSGGLEHFVQRDQGRLGVQRIEDRLQENEIDPAVHQGLRRLAVGGAEGGKVDPPRARVVHVRRDREGLVGGPQCAGDEARPLGGGCGVRCLARDPGAGEIEGAHLAGEAVVLLGHAVRVEGVGGDDVGARFEEARMDVADDLRSGDGEEVVVAGELAVVIGIERAAEVGLAQRVTLDHGAHRAVQHQHAPGRGRVERGVPCGAPAFRRPRGSRLSVVPSCYRHALPRRPAA